VVVERALEGPGGSLNKYAGLSACRPGCARWWLRLGWCSCWLEPQCPQIALAPSSNNSYDGCSLLNLPG